MPLHLERLQIKPPCVHRAVDQGIEIGCHPTVRAPLQRNVHLPGVWCQNLKVVRLPALVVHRHRHSCHAEGCKAGVEITGPNGQIPRFKAVGQRQRRELGKIGLPR